LGHPLAKTEIVSSQIQVNSYFQSGCGYMFCNNSPGKSGSFTVRFTVNAED